MIQDFDYINGDYSQLDLKAVGTALSRVNRYGGKGLFPISVARHLVMLGVMAPGHLCLAALIHDIPEIFTGEVPRPHKQLCPDFQALEDRITVRLFDSFGLDPALMKELAPWDDLVAKSEMVDIFPDDPRVGGWKNELAEKCPLFDPQRDAFEEVPPAFWWTTMLENALGRSITPRSEDQANTKNWR